MFLLVGLAPLVVLATGLVGSPSLAQGSHVTVPLSKRTSVSGISDFTKRDWDHWRNLVKRDGHRRQSSTENKTPTIPLNNIGGTYVATISVGDSPSEYQLLLDSGSALTWVGANKSYVRTKSSVKTKDSVNIPYSSGFMTGTLYQDTVTISKNITISQQSLGVASNSSGFPSVDGILGIGLNDLTFGILSPDNTTIVRTVTDNLFIQGKIQENLVAVSFEPTNSFPTVNGELTFGGIDSTKFIGELDYFLPSRDPSLNAYWSVDANVRYGSNKPILTNARGVIDTGTTLFGLATDAYNLYVNATGAKIDQNTGLLEISLDRYKQLQPLHINIGNRTYVFNANAQIWPRALNKLINGKKDLVYLIVTDLGPGAISDFVAGLTFLERFYAVFDSSQRRVGLANTRFTDWRTIN